MFAFTFLFISEFSHTILVHRSKVSDEVNVQNVLVSVWIRTIFFKFASQYVTHVKTAFVKRFATNVVFISRDEDVTEICLCLQHAVTCTQQAGIMKVSSVLETLWKEVHSSWWSSSQNAVQSRCSQLAPTRRLLLHVRDLTAKVC